MYLIKGFVFCIILQYSSQETFPIGQTHGQVWPKPQKIQQTESQYVLSPYFTMSYSDDEFCEIIENAFQRYYPRILGSLSIKIGFEMHARGWKLESSDQLKQLIVNVKNGCTSGFPQSDMDESYSLEVGPSQAVIESNEVWGALRGLETFTQLVYTGAGQVSRVVNKTSISDFPRFKFRGFLIDTSRHFLNLETIFKHIDAMEASKLNVLHWHIVDDDSFPFISHTYPDLSGKGAYNPYTHVFSHTNVHTVTEYARLRGIRVMPEFDTPGHTESWGKGYPFLLSQCIDSNNVTTFSGPLDPTMNTTYEFVAKLFNEVDYLFPDDALFLGGDEVSFSCWESNPMYADFIQQQGLDGYAGLESYYIQRLLDIVAHLSKHRAPVVWQEVFDNGLNITQETVVNIWKSPYTSEEKSVTAAGYQANTHTHSKTISLNIKKSGAVYFSKKIISTPQ